MEMKYSHPRIIHTAAVIGISKLLILAWFVLIPHAHVQASPGVHYVAPGKDCGGQAPCYSSIQEAVDAAKPENEIKVAAGTYTGVNTKGGTKQVVYVDKDLTIKGGYTTSDWNNPLPDTNLTEVNATAQGRVMIITGDIKVTVSGLYMSYGNAAGLGGHKPDADNEDAGGGLYIHQAEVVLEDVSVMTSTVSDGRGGGIYQGGGMLTANDCTLQGNYGRFGGGVYLYHATTELTGCAIHSNKADKILGSGGGVYLAGAATLISNTIQNNEAKKGGGLFSDGVLEDIDLVMISNLVANNKQGGIYLASVDSARLVGNTIRGNTDGSGLEILYGDVTVTGNTIENNTSGLEDGIGISLQGDAKITNNLIQNNTNQRNGAGVYLTGSGTNTIFAGNIIRDNQGNNFYTSGAGQGAGLYLDQCGVLTIRNNYIGGNNAVSAANKVAHGGGVYLNRCDALLVNNFIVDNISGGNGCGLYASGSSPFLYHTTIANNSGGDGSGVYAAESEAFNDPSVVSLYNSAIASQTIAVKVDPGSAQNVATVDGVLWHANGTKTEGTAFVFDEIEGDPDFVDPANGDYHIGADSLTIDAVAKEQGITDDYDREARPHYTASDLGADEWWPLVAVKAVTPGIAEPGDTVTYVITLTNATSSSMVASLDDEQPAEVTYLGPVVANYGIAGYASGAVTWDGTVLTTTPAVISWPVQVGAEATDAITNTAQVSDPYGAFETNPAVLKLPSGECFIFLPLILK
jgi:parallel beta-helix repeat protein